jgi:Pyruvate/2-oxoacid:ferredoxin oxidoreductase delta subunit
MMYDELIGNLRAKATHFHFNDETSLLLCKAADAIEELQKRKRGKWIYQFHEDEVGVTCSECEGYAESFARWIYDEGYRIDYNYCPNCGAEMESADDV